MTIVPDHVRAQPEAALQEAEALVAAGRALDAVDLLMEANRSLRDPAVERRLATLRYQAFDGLDRRAGFDRWPVPADGPPSTEGPVVPEISRDELSAEVVRRHVTSSGSVLVRNLLDGAQVDGLVRGIDHALAARAAGPTSEVRRTTSWYDTLPLPPEQARALGRHWVGASGGSLLLDSPKMLFEVLDTYERLGLRDVLGGYLGERPVLGGNKCTLKLVALDANADWHQDGAFLGAGIRTLNVWVALSDCGVDAPGMDLLPRRLDGIVETGSGGAIFDWAVGPAVVEELAVEAPVVRPQFGAGDALLFDELFLHRTAITPEMTRPRYALESWFFAPSHYPDGQVPIVW